MASFQAYKKASRAEGRKRDKEAEKSAKCLAYIISGKS